MRMGGFRLVGDFGMKPELCSAWNALSDNCSKVNRCSSKSSVRMIISSFIVSHLTLVLLHIQGNKGKPPTFHYTEKDQHDADGKGLILHFAAHLDCKLIQPSL